MAIPFRGPPDEWQDQLDLIVALAFHEENDGKLRELLEYRYLTDSGYTAPNTPTKFRQVTRHRATS